MEPPWASPPGSPGAAVVAVLAVRSRAGVLVLTCAAGRAGWAAGAGDHAVAQDHAAQRQRSARDNEVPGLGRAVQGHLMAVAVNAHGHTGADGYRVGHGDNAVSAEQDGAPGGHGRIEI